MADWWHSRQWRLIQTNLRETDMLDISAARVVADLLEFRANVLMINAAGIIASYPTTLPFHFQSPFLKGDSLHGILDACHAAGIHVIARTDFSKVRRSIYEQHPDWAYRSPGGEIVDYNGDVHVCINGPYQQHYALLIIEEVLETHDFDGIFFNMGGYQTRDYSGTYHGICHCSHCQERFGELFGLHLPAKEDRDDPVFRAYRQFQQQTMDEHHDLVYHFIAERWPRVIIANHTAFRRGFIRQESNTAVDRPLPHWQYDASDNTKWAVGSFPEMVSSNTTVDFIDFPYRHVAVSPGQQALRLAQSLANGGALDYYLIGRLDNHEDRSGFAAVKDLFHFHAVHETDYVGLHSVAEVMLLKAEGNQAEYRGWFRILVEQHIPFDVVRVSAALDVTWTRYATVIVPGIEALSDALTERLDGFVEAGGALVVTGKSGFYDEHGDPRPGPSLVSLGIEEVLSVRDDMRASYLKLVDKEGFPRFVDTDLVYLDGAYVYARYEPSADSWMQLVPPHHFGPPERCYYDLVVDHPGFVVHPFGEGYAIYVPWLPGALFYRQGHPNTAWFCADLLEQFAGVEPVGGALPPHIEITMLESEDGTTRLLHLVNASGHFGNSFYAPVPVRDAEVSIACIARPVSVVGLRCGEPLAYTWLDGRLTVRIAELGLFEAVRISWA
ncbi:MAG: beta-galactosidase trimerization domain-containing protein [Anaerolineae bacterium]|nr:beta-galactosidase trimerization domain-containing protein [Anaerolineae bacterium]